MVFILYVQLGRRMRPEPAGGRRRRRRRREEEEEGGEEVEEVEQDDKIMFDKGKDGESMMSQQG